MARYIPEAVHLSTLALKWDTSPEALRIHVWRHHGKASDYPIEIKNGRIMLADVEALAETYLRKKTARGACGGR